MNCLRVYWWVKWYNQYITILVLLHGEFLAGSRRVIQLWVCPRNTFITTILVPFSLQLKKHLSCWWSIYSDSSKLPSYFTLYRLWWQFRVSHHSKQVSILPWPRQVVFLGIYMPLYNFCSRLNPPSSLKKLTKNWVNIYKSTLHLV